MPQGTITRLNLDEGFGFIRTDGPEFFFHRSGLNGVGFEELAAGMPVDFSVGAKDSGDEPGEHPRAVNVRIREDVMPAEANEPLPPGKLGR